MDPMTVMGTLSQMFGTVRAGAEAGTAAHALLQQVRDGSGSPEEVDAELLRLSLLAVDRNVIVLEGVKLGDRLAEPDTLFTVVSALEVAPLSAMLLRWPQPPGEPAQPARNNGDLKAWNAQLERFETHEQLLAQARFIVVRTTGLCALSTVDAAARKQLRLKQRLRNLLDAHRLLRGLLADQDAIRHLTRRRSGAGQPPRRVDR